MSDAFRFGLVGIRGYGEVACRLLEESPVAKLTAVCPGPDAPPERVARLQAQGVQIIERYDDLLNEPIEAVWLPVPIHLHREFTEKALAAGKHVLCEKPAAGTVEDVDTMIAAQRRAGRIVAVGFQDLYCATTRTLRERLQDGAIGRIQSIVTHGAGPRGDKYFNRNTWAGKLQSHGRWVLDSIANNAHAHEIALCLHLAGGQPEHLEAELYRGNPIENYDTASFRVTLDNGVTLLVLLTHACEWFVDSLQIIQGDAGRVLRTRDVTVIEAGSRVEMLRPPTTNRDQMIRQFVAAARGEAAVPATLEMARAHTVVINGASEATAIHDIPATARRTAKTNQGECQAVPGMEAFLHVCALRQKMFHESGLFPWSQPPGRIDLRNYRHFAGPKGKP